LSTMMDLRLRARICCCAGRENFLVPVRVVCLYCDLPIWKKMLIYWSWHVVWLRKCCAVIRRKHSATCSAGWEEGKIICVRNTGYILPDHDDVPGCALHPGSVMRAFPQNKPSGAVLRYSR